MCVGFILQISMERSTLSTTGISNSGSRQQYFTFSSYASEKYYFSTAFPEGYAPLLQCEHQNPNYVWFHEYGSPNTDVICITYILQPGQMSIASVAFCVFLGHQLSRD